MKRINTRAMNETAVSRFVTEFGAEPVRVGAIMTLGVAIALAMGIVINLLALWAMSYTGMSVVTASILLSIMIGVMTVRGLRNGAKVMAQTADVSPLAKLLVASPGIHLVWSLSTETIALVISGVGIVTAVGGLLTGAMLLKGYRAITAK